MKAEIRELAERSARACTSGSGTWRRGTCEPCLLRTGKADRRGCFSFNTTSGWYKCFKCGLVGRVRGYEGIEDLEPESDEPAEQFDMSAPEGFTELYRGEGKTAFVFEKARNYLRSRLPDEKLWRAAQIGATLEGKFAGRVVVPVLNPDGDWVGYVGRVWKKKADLPYLYPKGMNRQVLYNHAALLEQSETPLFVVEGVMDALYLWPHAVAVLGKVSEPQLWALAEAQRPVAVCMDGDAWREGEELSMRLKLEGQRVGNIRLPPKKDPDEMEVSWLHEEARRVAT